MHFKVWEFFSLLGKSFTRNWIFTQAQRYTACAHFVLPGENSDWVSTEAMFVLDLVFPVKWSCYCLSSGICAYGRVLDFCSTPSPPVRHKMTCMHVCKPQTGQLPVSLSMQSAVLMIGHISAHDIHQKKIVEKLLFILCLFRFFCIFANRSEKSLSACRNWEILFY